MTGPCPNLSEILDIASVTNETTTQTAERFTELFVIGTPVPNTHFPVAKRSTHASVRDLLTIVDSSGSVGQQAYQLLKPEIGHLFSLFCPKDDPFDRSKAAYQQAAFITYSSTVKEVFDFNDYSGIEAIQQAINTAPYLGSLTCTGDAFEYGKEMFTSQKGARVGQTGVKQEVLIITDGQSNCGRDAREAARSLKAKTGADVFGLLVGDKTDSGVAEVAEYVSSPQLDHIFLLKEITEFKVFVQAIETMLNSDASLQCAPFK